MNEEQTMLYEAVRRYVDGAGRADRTHWRARTDGIWTALAELGLLGMAIPEQHGGSGSSVRDICTAMEAWGHGLLRAPLVATAVVGAGLIARVGSAAQRERWLPAIARGECRIALADLESGCRYDARHPQTRVRRHAEGYLLQGSKANVVDGDVADLLLVTACGGDRPEPSLFLVEVQHAGVQCVPFAAIDGGGCADIVFGDVVLAEDRMLGADGQGAVLREEAVEYGLVALCGEAVGAMQALLRQTADYLQQRHQFGQPLARFQALQHRIADMALDAGAARSAMLMAAAAIDAGDDTTVRRMLVAAAKSFVGEAGRRVGECAVQLHGGMGMTDEIAIGHYFKRLHAIDLTWGDAAHHLDIYGGLMAAD